MGLLLPSPFPPHACPPSQFLPRSDACAAMCVQSVDVGCTNGRGALHRQGDSYGRIQRGRVGHNSQGFGSHFSGHLWSRRRCPSWFCPSYLCSQAPVPHTLICVQAMHSIVPMEHASTKPPCPLALNVERESKRDLSRVHTQRGCEMEWQQSSEPFRTPRRKSVNRVCPCRWSGLGAEPTSFVPTQKPEARLRPKTLSQGRHDLGSK